MRGELSYAVGENEGDAHDERGGKRERKQHGGESWQSKAKEVHNRSQHLLESDREHKWHEDAAQVSQGCTDDTERAHAQRQSS